MEGDPRKKTLKCKFDLFPWVVTIMIPIWLMEFILECL